MFVTVTLNLLQGFGTTCLLFGVTLLFSVPLGALITWGCRARFSVLRAALRGLIWVIRGTPLMLQVLAVFYGPALLFGWKVLPRMLAVEVAFVINYACYFAEIYRGGLDSIPRGQYEAGQVLGMNRRQIFFRVILMQFVRRILAPMSNEVISLVKDTSLARVIVVAEILKNAQDWAAKGLIWPLFYTAVFYLVFVGILTLLFRLAEKKLCYYKI